MHVVAVSPRASVTVSEDFIMRILVADDEPEMVMVLEALLKREHYSVDAVYNGQDALDYGLGGKLRLYCSGYHDAKAGRNPGPASPSRQTGCRSGASPDRKEPSGGPGGRFGKRSGRLLAQTF